MYLDSKNMHGLKALHWTAIQTNTDTVEAEFCFAHTTEPKYLRKSMLVLDKPRQSSSASSC